MFVQIVSDKTATCFKISSLAAYPVHVVLLEFSKKHVKRLIQNGHSSVAFLPVDAEKSEVMREAEIAGPRESVYGYSTI